VLRDIGAWESVLARCGTTDHTVRRLVHLEGIVASTPRTDERASRDALLACDAVDEDVLARFVPSEPTTRFLLHAERSISDETSIVGDTASIDALIQVVVEGSSVPCAPGERIHIYGWLSGFGPPRNPGGFDMVGWARDRRIAAALRVERADLIRSAGASHAPRAWIARWRAAVDESLQRITESSALDASALVAASTTGAALPGLRSVARVFAACGIQHLVAISGFNFAILSGAVVCCLGFLRTPSRLVGIALLGLAALFMLSIELEVSSLRAAWMGGCVALTVVVGRRVPFSVVLSLSLGLLLLADPLSAHDPGLQLSFAAILGLRIGTEFIQRCMNGILAGPHLPMVLVRRALQPVWAAVGAWTATFPVIWMHFGSVPLLCIPCTLLLSPAFALMVVLANAGLAVDPLWRWGGYVIGQAAVLDARLVLCIARETARWPGSLPTPARGWVIADEIPWRVRIDMLDVGNGSCYLIRCGGACVLYDCGSLGAAAVGSRTVLPALFALGVERIDRVIISHPNLDHFGALPEVVRAIDVKEVVVTDAFLRWSDRDTGPAAAALCAVGQSGTPVHCVRSGDVVALGDIRLSVLHPQTDDPSLDANDSSLVVRIDAGALSILMTGDLAREGCPRVLESSGEMLDGIHVLELPHHGSFHPTAAALVKRISAPILLQSTGQQRWRNDRWAQVLDGSLRIVTARDSACAVLVDHFGVLHIGRWNGARYAWAASDVRVASAVDSAWGDEQGPCENDGVADWSIGRLFDFDFERPCNDWQCDRTTRVGAGHRLSQQFLLALTDDQHNIAPLAKCSWNLCCCRQGGEPLGDFVDEPDRPPDRDGCRRQWSGAHIARLWGITMNERQCCGRRGFHARRLKRE
jgi:competence protein ComEC